MEEVKKEMLIEDFELTLFDRIEVIKKVNKQYDLENNSYISYSGGKDSTVLSYLIDLAIPGNQIPRVFANTGMEFIEMFKYVNNQQKKDNRIIILNPKKPIKKVLENFGYPIKSKQHSHNVAIFQHSGINWSVKRYLGIVESNTKFRCPKILEYEFNNKFNLKCSDKCCLKMKKEPLHNWAKENNKSITILGLRTSEGDQRASHSGCVVLDGNNLTKFKPLNPISNEFEEWVINKYNIKLCSLYYPPFNFKRTGCKGCPFNIFLQDELDILSKHFPNEEKQCEIIWKPVYSEYRRIGYRLKNNSQMKLF